MQSCCSLPSSYISAGLSEVVPYKWWSKRSKCFLVKNEVKIKWLQYCLVVAHVHMINYLSSINLLRLRPPILFTFSRWRIEGQITVRNIIIPMIFLIIFYLFIIKWLLGGKTFLYVDLEIKTVCLFHFRFFPIFPDSWKILSSRQRCMVICMYDNITNDNSA